MNTLGVTMFVNVYSYIMASLDHFIFKGRRRTQYYAYYAEIVHMVHNLPIQLKEH